MLEAEGVDLRSEVDTYNILSEENMREEVKEFSDWPTFPQVLILSRKCPPNRNVTNQIWSQLWHLLGLFGGRVLRRMRYNVRRL